MQSGNELSFVAKDPEFSKSGEEAVGLGTMLSRTPTAHEETDKYSSRNVRDENEETQHDLYPGPDEQTKHPFLVEFEPNDPMNPKVKMYKSLNNRVRLIYSTELVKALQMVYNSLRWDFGAQCVRFILKRA